MNRNVQKEKNTNGFGTFRISENKLDQTGQGTYNSFDAQTRNRYDVSVEGLTEAQISHASSNVPLNKKHTDELEEKTYAFGKKELKLNAKLIKHQVTKEYENLNSDPIYKETHLVGSKDDPKNYELTIKKYHKIEDKFEWTENLTNGEISGDSIRPSEPNKYKIKSLDEINIAENSVNSRVKLGLEIKEIGEHRLEPDGFMGLGFRDTESVEEKVTNFAETSEIDNTSSTQETNLNRVYEEKPSYTYTKEIVTKSDEGFKGIFLNKTTTTEKTETRSNETFNRKQNVTVNKSLNDGTLRAVSTVSSGLVNMFICKRGFNVHDVGKLTVDTAKSFANGHLSTIAKTQKSVKFAAPVLALTSVVASTAKTVIACSDKDDKRTTRKKVTDEIVECGVDIVPAIVQIGLTVKNVAKANMWSTVANIAVDAGVNTYHSIRKYKSDDPDEKITGAEAVGEVGQNLAISAASAAGAAVTSSLAIAASTLAIAKVAAFTPLVTTGVVALAVSALPYVAAGVVGAFVAYGVQKLCRFCILIYINWKMRRALKKLCKMYGLEVKSSDKEFESFFRKKAKGIHPDSPRGSHEAFCKLQKDMEEIVKLRKNLHISEVPLSSWKKFFEDLLFKWTELSIFDSIKKYWQSNEKEKNPKQIKFE